LATLQSIDEPSVNFFTTFGKDAMDNTFEARWISEIRELNLSYLMLAQSMVRSDKAQALFALGVSEPVADILAELSPSQMIKIATGNQLLSRFRFDDEIVWSLLAEHGRKAPQGLEANASRLHASIVMAGNFAEAV
jgi:flagellar transcriptional activator FlhD